MRSTSLIALAAFALLATGCEALGQLAQDKIVIGTVLQTPDLEAPDGTTLRPGLVAADVFFGEKDAAVDVLASTPTSILGAQADLVIYKDLDNLLVTVPLPDRGDGHYATTSADAPELVYAAGAEYRTELTEIPGQAAYVVDVSRAPAAEPPQGVPDVHAAGVDLTVERTGASPAFVSVLRLDGAGIQETWTNRPTDPVGLLSVVVDPTPWEAASFTIPGGEAFPSAGDYAVVLTSVERGIPDMSLFTASGVFVGAGAARSFRVE